MTNPILKTIKERSSIRFKSTPVSKEKLNAFLDSGKWAPSWTNTQPWRFIVVKDNEIKKKLSGIVTSFFSLSIMDAPISIAICVNPKKDPFHYIEDGTTVTQNMTLAAQSIGLSTAWIGVFSLKNEKGSTERKLKEILEIPKDWRLISILPLGVPNFKETKSRKDLSELVDTNRFLRRDENTIIKGGKEKPSPRNARNLQPSSAHEIEPALV